MLWSNHWKAHFPYDAPVKYQSTTAWWGDKDTLAEGLWYNLGTRTSVIVLSDELSYV